MQNPVAVVDRLGYQYCANCAERLDKTGIPVYADSRPHNTELCDSCEKPCCGEDIHVTCDCSEPLPF